MNATQSTGDPLTDVSLWELWGIIWLSYVSATGLVVLIYDSLLTLDDEVRLIFSYFVPPYRLFLDAPCLARVPIRAKSTLLHQSLPIHFHCSLFKLPSVPQFIWLVDPSVERLPEISGLHPPLSKDVGFFHSSSSATKVLTGFSCPFPCMRLLVWCELTNISVAKLGSGCQE